MEKKGTSVFSNSLIWFGAGVSIAEIVTGTYLASLGMSKGILATIIGHLIGCTLLFLAGIIGARKKEANNIVPGVAIATALMPPVCTVGYSIATGNLEYMVVASYLFSINCSFIMITHILALM